MQIIKISTPQYKYNNKSDLSFELYINTLSLRFTFIWYFHTIDISVAGPYPGTQAAKKRGNAVCSARAKPSVIYVFLVFIF